MDMLMSGAAALLLLFLVGIAGLSFALVRVFGAREVRGDHPGEPGYDPAEHQPR